MDLEVDQEQENQRFLTLLEALKKVSKDLRSNPISLSNNESETTVEVLSKLETEAATAFSMDPKLLNLSRLLCSLKTLLERLEQSQSYSLKSILCCQITKYKISQVAFTTEAEIQAFLDRESIQILARTLTASADEDKKGKVLIELKNRVCQGFDRDFQDLVLRAKVFSILESILCDSTCSQRLREQAALAVDALVRFNKNVFVGLVFMGPTIGALISMGSRSSIQVLCSLIRFIRSPLIDEMESNCEVPRIVNLLRSEDLSIRAAALDCILELAYFGRDEVITVMLGEDLVRKLMEVQRFELGTSSVLKKEYGGICVETESETRVENKESEHIENYPFEGCVTRFAVQVEVGHGLNKIEKTEVKLEILRRVREASVSEAESATVEMEVLWLEIFDGGDR
ncbi:uncharacterized protein LOC122316701 [Carya illinoinensis]|uniref:ARM repeat superfamily protein n=1 Tax=Carya illinoinensis TaxID=32201 RepID=A0A8T1PZA2_CARIL|nr:uncharacterized protein LOC122316701 [Carya illinoinensis]KAG6649636.1 hypothetical protein CIPAW_07G225200 [Carya illinoinensis]KAG6706539.1 hypothetical protein I3842_07G226600 [Carya illinoinensis]